jgi:putative ABC transport system substrate-binding protein
MAKTSESYERAAVFVDKILRGAKPAILPVEQARTFELVVNMTAARAIGVTFPETVLQRADQILP